MHRFGIACTACLVMVFWTGAAKSHLTRPVHGNSAAVAAVSARDDLYTRGSERQDVKLLSSLWADTFIDTNGAGKVRDKQQMLDLIAAAKKSGQKILSISISDRRTQVYRDAAVVTGMYTTRIRAAGKVQTGKGRFTDVWVKQGGVWNCVAAHSSPVR